MANLEKYDFVNFSIYKLFGLTVSRGNIKQARKKFIFFTEK